MQQLLKKLINLKMNQIAYYHRPPNLFSRALPTRDRPLLKGASIYIPKHRLITMTIGTLINRYGILTEKGRK